MKTFLLGVQEMKQALFLDVQRDAQLGVVGVALPGQLKENSWLNGIFTRSIDFSRFLTLFPLPSVRLLGRLL